MDFVSRKRIEEDIIKSLMKSSVSMIGICGMGGVGKTTMARRIKDRVMEEKLFEEAVMVVVSQEINEDKIQEEIAELFGLDIKGINTLPAKASRLNTRLKDAKRKLIIFDDVWKSFKLEDLGVPFGRVFQKCKILLTTRDKGVCEQMEAQEIIPIEILTEDEAWNLFKEKAGDRVEDSDLRNVAKEVVAECKGLPIALVTVGKALQNRGIRTWRDSLSQLRQANPDDFPDVLKDVYKPLKLSYDELDNKHQQLLFLLCCLFPEDYDIPMEELTLYFMGLQIFENITSIEETRERMHNLVENLKRRFLLIDGEYDFHVKMHDVVRDVAIYIGWKEKDCLVKSLNKISIENSIENSSDINCNWMSVDVSNEPMNVDIGLRFPELRLLMLKHLRSDISLKGIRDLNVLSYANLSIESLPPTLALLQNLRTLYLDHCAVEDISVIGELAALEILYCHYCYKIKELPAEIERLNRLRILELNECRDLQRIPFGVLSSLVRLEELKMFRSFKGWEADENGKEMMNASVRELESLPNLTCLEIQISDSNLAAQEMRLSPNLVKYKIFIEGDERRIRFDWEKERDKYEKEMDLNLPSGIGAVGKWIQILVMNTEYLSLQGDGSNNFSLEECQDLRILKVTKCSTMKKLVKTKDWKSGIIIPMLERLKLRELENIEEICDGTIILNQNVSSLCNLKSVQISFCPKLRYLFSESVATTCLLQLEVLRVEDCDAMEQVFRKDVTNGCIEFPKLNELKLFFLPNLTAFSQGLQTIKFPNLTKMWIQRLPKLNSFCPLNSETGNHDTNSFHFLCNPKVEICGLKTLKVTSFNYSNIWCHQIPINFFNNLQNLSICSMHRIRSLMSYSIANNFVSLKDLIFWDCNEMVEVIEGNDDDKEIVDIKSLFPILKKLEFGRLPKLRRFWQWNHALELPILEDVIIINCRVMETFTLGSLNTPNLKRLVINGRTMDDMKELNNIPRHYFRTKD